MVTVFLESLRLEKLFIWGFVCEKDNLYLYFYYKTTVSIPLSKIFPTNNHKTRLTTEIDPFTTNYSTIIMKKSKSPSFPV